MQNTCSTIAKKSSFAADPSSENFLKDYGAMIYGAIFHHKVELWYFTHKNPKRA